METEVQRPMSEAVWGSISYEGLGPVYRIPGHLMASGYMEIIIYTLLPYALDGPFPDGLFHLRQDGTYINTAKAVSNMPEGFGIMTPHWPVRSPDLNIIENIRGIMKNNPGLTTATSDQL